MMPFSQLLQKNPEKRLGAGEQDADEVKRHRIFQVTLLHTWHTSFLNMTDDELHQ